MSNARQLPSGWFYKGLRTQVDVIGALIMRELHTRYGRENIGYLWLFLEPFILATSVGLLHWGHQTHYSEGVQGVPFAIIGYCTFVIFRNIFNRAEGTLESNMPLLYHRMVTVFDMLLARALLEGAGVGLTCFILLGLSSAIGVAELPARPLWGVLAMMLMTWWSFALSLIVCAGTFERRGVAKLIHPVSYVMMPISGAFYMLQWLGEPFRTWMSWFPMTQMFEMARYGVFKSAKDDYFDVLYISVWCAILMGIGMLAVKIVRKHVHLH